MVAAENVNPDGDVSLDPSWVQRFHMVLCLVCGADTLKPDVVYFGEAVPPERKAAVDELIQHSASLLVVGSSMAVMSQLPASQLVSDVAKTSPAAIHSVQAALSRAFMHASWLQTPMVALLASPTSIALAHA